MTDSNTVLSKRLATSAFDLIDGPRRIFAEPAYGKTADIQVSTRNERATRQVGITVRELRVQRARTSVNVMLFGSGSGRTFMPLSLDAARKLRDEIDAALAIEYPERD